MKRLLAMITCALLAFSTGCSRSNESSGSSTIKNEKVSLKLWGSQEDQGMLTGMVDSFKKAHPDKTYDITLGVVSEADAKSEVLKDVAVAGDVFCFAGDQIAELKNAGALYRVTKNKDAVISNNTPASIAACTIDNELYAYPSSSDTYFMYYDKSKFTEDEVKSVEKMLAKDLGANVKNFVYNIDDGWYNAGFFFANGCTLFGKDGLDPKSCDFNSANGVAVGKYLVDLVKNPRFADYKDDGQLLTNVQSGTYAAVVTGTWNSEAIKGYLGANYAATKLPTIMIDGKEKQLSSMANFKLYGVNSQTKHPSDALALAEFLTSKECQKIRFDKRSFAPTNKDLAADEAALSSNIAVSALANQSQFATLQASIPQMGKYWEPAEAFGAGIIDGTVTKENMQQKLDALVQATLATIS